MPQTLDIRDVPGDLLEKIEPKFEKLAAAYKFDWEQHKISRLDLRIEPSVVPMMIDYLLNQGKIISEKALADKLLTHPDFNVNANSPEASKYTDEQIARARVRQFWTGVMREIHVMICLNRLDPQGIIQRDYTADLGKGGVDILYTRSSDDKQFKIAVTHEGQYTDRYVRSRKYAKRDANVIELRATRSSRDGLHLVPEEKIEELVDGTVG